MKNTQAVQIAHHAMVKVPDPPRIQKALRLIPQVPPGKMADIGYAKASFADSLAEHGWRCIGLDLSPQNPPHVKFVQCDFNEGIPLGSEAFDLATAGEVIEHVFDEAAFLQECYRILKRGGLLVLTTPNLCFLLNRFLVLIGRTPLFVTAPYHYHFHTLQTITQCLSECGFRVEKATSSHLLYSTRRHWTGALFERLGDLFPTFGAHLIVLARKP